MTLGGPNVYPGVLTWLGVARELTAGTPVNPVITHPLEQNTFEPEDMPRFLKDNAIRGSMTDLFYETLGVESATFNFGGPNFLDSHGYFMDNIFGDLSTTCNSLTNPATVSGSLAIGATSMTLSSAPPTQFTAGAYIQIGTATTGNTPGCYLNEVVQISSTTPSSVVNFINNPLRFPHPGITGGSTVAGSTVASVASGTTFTHRFAALNSALGYGAAYGAQPPTHTFTDVTNIVTVFTSATYGTAPTNTYGARQYPSACLKSMDFTGNAEQLLNIRMQGESWLSTVATSAVTNLTTNSRPIPNWNTTLDVLGTQITNIGEFGVTFVRTTQVYWTVQGIQSPFIIARGPLNMNGTIQWDPAQTEEPLDLMLLNAQGPMTITVTNSGIPNSGTPFTLEFTASQVANIKSKIMRNKALVGYNNSFEGVANATDTGGSGGLGPGTLTLTNSTPTYNYTNWDEPVGMEFFRTRAW